MTDPVHPVVVTPQTAFEKWKFIITPVCLILLALAANKGWLTPAQIDQIKPMVMSPKPGETVTVTTTPTVETPVAKPRENPVTPVVVPPTPATPPKDGPQVVVAISPDDIQQWLKIIKDLIDQLKPSPQPTPVPPVPPVPVPPKPPVVIVVPDPPPTDKKIVITSETGTVLTAATVDAGTLWLVTSSAVTGVNTGWQTTHSGTVHVAELPNHLGYAFSLEPGSWAEFFLTDFGAKSQSSIRISCNTAPRPPPIDPTPAPVPPVPDPTPVPVPPKPTGVANVGYEVAYDPLAITPSTAKCLNDAGWLTLAGIGDSYRFYATATTEPGGVKALDALKTAGVPPPGLVIRDNATGAVLKSVPLPKTFAECQTLGNSFKAK